MSSTWRSFLASSSSRHFAAFIAVVALVDLGAGIALYTALPKHQAVNRAAKGDALVGSGELQRLALKVPGPDMAGVDESASLPAPVSDTDVFGTNQSCLAPEEAIHRFQSERSVVGGKVILLAEGLQQSFADVWRVRAQVAPMKVSSVLAHLFEGPAEEWVADVIEFDAKKCAMSRTLVPGDAWNALIVAALGPQA